MTPLLLQAQLKQSRTASSSEEAAALLLATDRPRISVIVPSANAEGIETLLSAIRAMDYPQANIEVILALGDWPSTQRNQAVRRATGELLFFFNKDAGPEPSHFNTMVDIFEKHPDVVAAGGPDLTPADNTPLQHLFGYAMMSRFAHWRMRARYTAEGETRRTDERELILSNMAIRRETFIKLGGFHEDFWPNEENEILNRMQLLGLGMVYCPQARVFRDKRPSVGAFMFQFFRYGRGRMTQMFQEGMDTNIVFLLPLFFGIYLLALPALMLLTKWAAAPLVAYGLIAAADAIHVARLKNSWLAAPALPFVYLCMHLSYAGGLFGESVLRVLGRTRRKAISHQHPEQIEIQQLKEFEKKA